MIIYKITNSVNSKVYVGQTTRTMEERWIQHKGDKFKYDYPLYRAMRKYGVENFTIEELCKADTKEDLNLLEVYHAKLQNAMSPRGYSLRAGNAHGTHCQATKDKISLACKGKPKQGVPHTEKTRLQMSESHKGMIFSEEHKYNLSMAAKKRIFSREHRMKIGKTKHKSILCLNNNKTYESITAAAIELDLNKANIVSVCRSRIKQTKGFRFKYL